MLIRPDECEAMFSSGLATLHELPIQKRNEVAYAVLRLQHPGEASRFQSKLEQRRRNETDRAQKIHQELIKAFQRGVNVGKLQAVQLNKRILQQAQSVFTQMISAEHPSTVHPAASRTQSHTCTTSSSSSNDASTKRPMNPGSSANASLNSVDSTVNSLAVSPQSSSSVIQTPDSIPLPSAELNGSSALSIYDERNPFRVY
jgi:hypothetical protein